MGEQLGEEYANCVADIEQAHLVALRWNTSASFRVVSCKEGHAVQLCDRSQAENHDPQWRCDGGKGSVACASGDGQTLDSTESRYRCQACDYDLCGQCYQKASDQAEATDGNCINTIQDIDELYRACTDALQNKLPARLGLCCCRFQPFDANNSGPGIWELRAHELDIWPGGCLDIPADVVAKRLRLAQVAARGEVRKDAAQDRQKDEAIDHPRCSRWAQQLACPVQWAVAALHKSRVPIIVHDGLLDLLHIYDKFAGAVPERHLEFGQACLTVFPLVFDTCLLAHGDRSQRSAVKQQMETSLDRLWKLTRAFDSSSTSSEGMLRVGVQVRMRQDVASGDDPPVQIKKGLGGVVQLIDEEGNVVIVHQVGGCVRIFSRDRGKLEVVQFKEFGKYTHRICSEEAGLVHAGVGSGSAARGAAAVAQVFLHQAGMWLRDEIVWRRRENPTSNDGVAQTQTPPQTPHTDGGDVDSFPVARRKRSRNVIREAATCVGAMDALAARIHGGAACSLPSSGAATSAVCSRDESRRVLRRFLNRLAAPGTASGYMRLDTLIQMRLVKRLKRNQGDALNLARALWATEN